MLSICNRTHRHRAVYEHKYRKVIWLGKEKVIIKITYEENELKIKSIPKQFENQEVLKIQLQKVFTKLRNINWLLETGGLFFSFVKS